MHDNSECGGMPWMSTKYSKFTVFCCPFNLVVYYKINFANFKVEVILNYNA